MRSETHFYNILVMMSFVMYNKTKYISNISDIMLLFSLFFLSCASDIKIAPQRDSATTYGLELDPKSYHLISVPIQSEYTFDFVLLAHEKTTINQIDFVESFDENIWYLSSFLEPPITLSAGSKMNFEILAIPPYEGFFKQEIQIVSSHEDWNISLEIEGIVP